mmetsp:Transcript_25124/g.82392  ORF Transcript_25124/g.82392 Transcript_25124/m.82392 type:complete len:273 (-) Transcript_25124:466-1284(-)
MPYRLFGRPVISTERTPAPSRALLHDVTQRSSSCGLEVDATASWSCEKSSGSKYRKHKSSSSALRPQIPRRFASGTNTSSVSRDMVCCLCDGITLSVRMLWRRSASLMITTRASVIASSIVRSDLSIELSSSPTLSRWSWLTLLISETDETRSTTALGKCDARSSLVASVSSRVSWRIPAATTCSSRPQRARMSPVSTQCARTISPERRYCPSCALAATRKALRTTLELANTSLSPSAYARSSSTGSGAVLATFGDSGAPVLVAIDSVSGLV